MLVLNVRLKEAKLGSVRLAPCRKLIAARVDFGRANREDIAEAAGAGVGHILEFEGVRTLESLVTTAKGTGRAIVPVSARE